jgi:hypothetical protein
MTITIEQTIYDPIPTGKYPAKVMEIEQVEGQFGPQLKFKFEIPNVEGEKRELISWASMKFSPQSKLYAWTQAAVFSGGSVPREYTFNSDDMVGRKVNLVVIEKEGKNGNAFSQIENVLPFSKPAPTPPPPDEGEDW